MLRADGLDLCEEFLHWAAKQRDGLPTIAEGTTLVAAAEALADLGQPPEDVWPYDEHRDQAHAGYGPPDGALEEARGRRLSGGWRLDPNTASVRDALDAGLAVILGLRLHAGWYAPQEGGLVPMPPGGTVALGGHAVLLVGYWEGDGEGGGRFIVRNSWGVDWADGGYGYLPYAYVNAHGLQAWGLAPPAVGEAKAADGASCLR